MAFNFLYSCPLGLTANLNTEITLLGPHNLVPRAFPLKVGGAALPPSSEKPWERG